jgi:HD-GYP domain-containing protein (c-di-GMP phosphodiesterase class II)
MTKPRTYEECLSVDEAIVELERCAGSQFDPDIAAAFIRMIQQVHGTAPRDRAGGQPTPPARPDPGASR